MEHLLAPLLLTGALLASPPLYQDNALPLHSVLTDSELGDYHRKRHYKNRIDLFRKVFHRRADSLKELVKLGDFSGGAETVAPTARAFQTCCSGIVEGWQSQGPSIQTGKETGDSAA